MSESVEDDVCNFNEMGLDDRILEAIAKQGWSKPTPIQEKAIPLALEGKDILARARTGSGKTAAFCIPLIQKILDAKQTMKEQCVKAVILTPTKELCSQAYKHLQLLTTSCSREVKVLDISPQLPLPSQRPLLIEKPDVVVGTPTRILAHIKAGNLNIRDSLELLIVDEADLIFSFGYEDDIKGLLNHLPNIYQAFLMSATLSEDVKALRKMVLHNAVDAESLKMRFMTWQFTDIGQFIRNILLYERVILRLEESALPEASRLTQYHIKCDELEKFTLICALFKLNLVRGKSIIFVNQVNRCYKLKLFLEQFGINACVLNSELPMNSRCHIVGQFNDGLYDYIIASDENMLLDPKAKPDDGKRKKHKKDKEYGISRGIDFQNVANVINFDFPDTVDAYIHRVGRTARGDNNGCALSFVSIQEMKLLKSVEEVLKESTPEGEDIFKPYNFKMEEIEGFKYRAKDAMKMVTKTAIRESRLKEIKSELLKSEKLKTYFEENPRDLQLLRHDKSLHTVKSQSHMKHVPDYLVPKTLKRLQKSHKQKDNQPRQGQKRNYRGSSKAEPKFKRRKADPLNSFKFAGLGKEKKKKKKS